MIRYENTLDELGLLIQSVSVQKQIACQLKRIADVLEEGFDFSFTAEVEQ